MAPLLLSSSPDLEKDIGVAAKKEKPKMCFSALASERLSPQKTYAAIAIAVSPHLPWE